jgi:hypothetical protein
MKAKHKRYDSKFKARVTTICLRLLGCSMCVTVGAWGQETVPGIQEEFQNPAVQYRPLIITHSRWLGKPEFGDYLEKRRLGGAVVDEGIKSASKNSDGELSTNPNYLNDPARLQDFRAMFEDLRKRGQRVWIYDELGYPSASAGGRVLEGRPEFQVWAVGSRTFTPAPDGTVTVEVSHPTVEACCAMPLRAGQLVRAEAQDLTAQARQGRFVWKSPGTNWIVCLFERYQPDSWRRHNIPRRNVNILDRAAIQRFIELTHDKYAETLGPRLQEVELFFTDEPQFGATEHWGSGLPDAPAAVQWCDELPVAFKKKYGYEVSEALPALFHSVGPKTGKYRQDFYDVQSDLVAENYFGQIQDWCHRHGVQSSGHLLLEESLLFHVMFSGSFWKNFARMDIPGVDLIGNVMIPYKTMPSWGIPSREDYTCKFASSVAHLLRKPGVFTETFALAQKATLREVLGVTAWQFAGGITHMSTYTIQDHLSPEEYATFADYAGRLAFFCRRGTPVADVAILIPERSVWAAYNPPDGGRVRRYFDRNPEALRIDEVFRLTSQELLRNQRDFEYLTEEALQSAPVEQGRLAIADEQFLIMVLPEFRMMHTNTIEKVRSFVKSGGRVVFVGSLPRQTPENGDDPEITRQASALVAAFPRQITHVETTSDLPQVIAWMKEQVPPTVTWSGPDGIRIMRRHEPGREILLVANPAKSNAGGKLSLLVAGHARVWNPETGAVESLGQQKTGAAVNLALPGESARIVTIEANQGK